MIFLKYLEWDRYPVQTALCLLLAVVVIVQCFYLLFVFIRLAFFRQSENPAVASPSVSIVICARNELQNLQELIPILVSQLYRNFDIIVAIDRSTDGSVAFLREQSLQFKQLKFIEIDKDYDHVTPKKYALTAAIRSSDKDVILLTDADCRPQSNQWVRQMASQLTDNKDIVLGFSPYYKQSGFLNRLIRFETFYVALQYLSFALSGRPYMGVGRNLMYRRALFIKNRGFYTHLSVIGGDDDLLMNEIATAQNTAICVHPDSFCHSIPKQTWSDWFTQKKRHLSVSKHYKTKNKMRLGGLSASQVLSWVVFICFWVSILIVGATASNLALLGIGLFVGVKFCQWLVFILINHKLGKPIGWYALPFLDLVLSFYYIVMGLVMWANRKQKVKWR